MNTETKTDAEVLGELLAGVRLDEHYDPLGKQKVEALERTIARLRGEGAPPEQAVAWIVEGNVEQGLSFDKDAAEVMAFANCGTVRPLVYGDTAPPRPEASECPDCLNDGCACSTCNPYPGEQQPAAVQGLVLEPFVALAAALEAAEARAEAAEAEIDWIKAQPDDDGRMFAEIEAAAKASYRRHRSSVRGQVLTRADKYESHLVWAALEWASRTKEQRA